VTPKASPSYSATAGLPFDDEELESRLVWIWGSPRSGSTWLLEMLCHPFRMDPEADLGFRRPPRWDGDALTLPVNEFQIAAHLAPGVYGDSAGHSTIEDEDGAVLPRTLNRVIGYFPSYAFSSTYADVWRPEARRLTLVRLYAVIEQAKAAGLRIREDVPLLVIKEVNGSHGADLVMSLFPRSRMIFLVRDGRDVLDSLLDANKAGGWLTKRGWGQAGFDTAAERREFIEQSSRHWTARMNVCSRAFDAHDPSRRTRVRYEDLLADTAARLGELERWLGLPSGPRRMQSIAVQHSFAAVPEGGRGSGKLHRAASPGSWREGLEPAEQAAANEIMGDTLAQLGYEK
jgi:Sulfotransferase family